MCLFQAPALDQWIVSKFYKSYSKSSLEAQLVPNYGDLSIQFVLLVANFPVVRVFAQVKTGFEMLSFQGWCNSIFFAPLEPIYPCHRQD